MTAGQIAGAARAAGLVDVDVTVCGDLYRARSRHDSVPSAQCPSGGTFGPESRRADGRNVEQRDIGDRLDVIQ